MLTTAQILAFLLTAVMLTATPGPDNLMVLSIGMSKGRRAGIAFGLGCALGELVRRVQTACAVGAAEKIVSRLKPCSSPCNGQLSLIADELVVSAHLNASASAFVCAID